MSAEVAMLLMVEGPVPGKRFFVEQPVLLMGRDETCEIVIPERQVSRRHASIHAEGDRYILKDLDSKNGTFVNGQPVLGPHTPPGWRRDPDRVLLQAGLCRRRGDGAGHP